MHFLLMTLVAASLPINRFHKRDALQNRLNRPHFDRRAFVKREARKHQRSAEPKQPRDAEPKVPRAAEAKVPRDAEPKKTRDSL
ncbi:hypothetical protein EDD86DRAFT_248979 [Gorgonomyces haynaldii]|nr:hypothetical protein EDD86DRAFT_248979 [Gorgonomyces haynaldii]